MTMNPQRGYTLIELIVSVGIFSMIMLLATGAYLSLLGYNRQARAMSVVMSDLSYAMDQMSRELRTGTHFTCPTSGCAHVSSVSFTNDQNQAITYMLANGALARCVNQPVCNANTATPVTNPDITVSTLDFTISGNATYASGDRTQPLVLISVVGKVTAGKQSAPFSIETSATQRLLDL